MTKIVDRPTIEKIIAAANSESLIRNIEQAFEFYSSGKAVVPPVGTLSFDSPPGDVHIKYGYVKGEQHYVIKIASGFYDNAKLGLPGGNGLNLVFNQKSGVLETILMDEAHLTDVRTAVAGAVCAKHLMPGNVKTIGIVGTGVQARLQLRFIKDVVDCRKVIVWGRSQDKLDAYKNEMEKDGFEVETTLDSQKISENCNLIVTTTASTEPIIKKEGIQSGTLIIAMGADTIGKQEIENEILMAASLIVLDSTSQCEDHGEIHKAFQAGLLENKKMMEVGEFISKGKPIGTEDLVVADLTGIATQDIQISKFVLDNLDGNND